MMECVETRYGKLYLILSDSVVSESLRLYGEWAQHELDFLGKLVAPGDFIADIGGFIGSHTLALASFVGQQGCVHTVEVRRELFEILRANVSLNRLENVVLHHCAIGEKDGQLKLSAVSLDAQQNFGGLSVDDGFPDCADGGYSIDQITLDSLSFERLDFIKLDVEGMEVQVLAGAVQTLQRCRTLVFAECNSVASGALLLEFAAQHGYSAYGWIGAAFNPENYKGCKSNIFGDGKEVSLLLVPVEREQAVLNAVGAELAGKICTADDLVLLLLHKPQYAYEQLSRSAVADSLGIAFPSPYTNELKASYEVQLSDIERQRHELVLDYEKRLSEIELNKNEWEIKKALLSSKISRLENELTESQAALMVAQARLVALEGELSTVYSSRCWRYTKVFRR